MFVQEALRKTALLVLTVSVLLWKAGQGGGSSSWLLMPRRSSRTWQCACPHHNLSLANVSKTAAGGPCGGINLSIAVSHSQPAEGRGGVQFSQPP